MMWAGLHNDACTALVKVNGALSGQMYLDEILQHHVVPLINVTGGILQLDNARPHSLPKCSTANNVHVLPWPARSADLSPIEHLWDILDRRVHPPQTLQELFLALQNEWQNILQLTIQTIAASKCGHNRH